MSSTKKSDRRDRYDRTFIKNADSMHILFPYMFKKRCDNEAVLGEVIDITAINDYLKKRNAENPAFKYTWFHVIAAAFAKTVLLRPKMNRFYSGYRYYERKGVEIAFVVKRTLDENSEEALAKVAIDPEGGSLVDQVHDYVADFVTKVRHNGEVEGATEKMDIFRHMPRFLIKIIFGFLRLLEYWGWYPKSLRVDDPSYSSIFISNLGSIKMVADYHHLFEWGTNSFFALISEKKMRPVFNEDGTYEMRDTIKLGLTIDERIADGLYFAGSIKMLRHLLQHPELLDLKANTPIDYD